jgi:hypothetical protein
MHSHNFRGHLLTILQKSGHKDTDFGGHTPSKFDPTAMYGTKS